MMPGKPKHAPKKRKDAQAELARRQQDMVKLEAPEGWVKCGGGRRKTAGKRSPTE